MADWNFSSGRPRGTHTGNHLIPGFARQQAQQRHDDDVRLYGAQDGDRSQQQFQQAGGPAPAHDVSGLTFSSLTSAPDAQRTARVLVSAFEPFGGRQVNRSQAIAQEVAGFLRKHVEVTLVSDVPVSWNESFPFLRLHLARAGPQDLVLMLGEDSKLPANETAIETVARNHNGTGLRDQGGRLPGTAQIDVGRSETDVVETPLGERVMSVPLPAGVQVSHDAGDYICNNLAYHAYSAYPNSLFAHVGTAGSPQDDQAVAYSLAKVAMGVIQN
jgi:pyrrolidone-carboxylate peptidase